MRVFLVVVSKKLVHNAWQIVEFFIRSSFDFFTPSNLGLGFGTSFDFEICKVFETFHLICVLLLSPHKNAIRILLSAS